jgi:N-acylneuraminate cytidylyltransferase
MKLAVIPARGGSKRIPRKNIKLFGGKPMIAWSIEAAIQSGCFDRIIVSTDDAEIADVARAYGAEVPFVRPPELSDDHTATIPVVAHAIQWISQQFDPVELACCLYATAPFIQSKDLQQGLNALQQSDALYALTVTNFAAPIQRSFRITQQQRIEMFNPDQYNMRSQDLEEAYHDAGQFYWGRAEAWLSSTPLHSEFAIPLLLPRYRVQDIDTMDDWIRAEMMFEILNKQAERNHDL